MSDEEDGNRFPHAGGPSQAEARIQANEPQAPEGLGQRLVAALHRRTRFLLYATCALSLLSLGGSASHWLDLTSHFRPHYLCVLLLGSVGLALTRSWRQLPLVVVCLALNTWSVVPWYLPSNTVQSAETTPLRILLANVLSSNTEHDRLLQLIQHEQPDLIVLLETDDRWIAALEPLKETYPTQLNVSRSDNFGIALYSRLEITDLEVVDFGAGAPSITGTLTLGERATRLIATHPLPPIGGEYSRLRNEQLAAIASSISGSTIVVGDLNVTMWSPIYADFEAASGLRNVRRGFGILPTWPSRLAPLGIPLDHCLTSEHFAVQDVRAGSSIGSDHRPLLVELRTE